MKKSLKSFIFHSYHFNHQTGQADFHYQGPTGIQYTETIHFKLPKSKTSLKDDKIKSALLDRALFLAFIIIGTSYYKAHPTTEVILPRPLNKTQKLFFDQVYQAGLSQYAFENQLTKKNLAVFPYSTHFQAEPALKFNHQGIIALQSGGKDSLLTATILESKNLNYTPLFISPDGSHPNVLDKLKYPLTTLIRRIDTKNLKKARGKNGHVPVTYINLSIALIQAILENKNTVLASIGQEGNEPNTHIGDLPVNHQWSKTWPAEQFFAKYVKHYISADLQVGSILRPLSELHIAKQFVQKCWDKYGHDFSSCNQANYKQNHNTTKLTWCGQCPKCANSYLLFAPFLPAAELNQLFNQQNLFTNPQLTTTFKGLLGVDDVMKPLECVGEIAELRTAYHLRQADYGKLPFEVPSADFDYKAFGPHQTLSL